MHVTFRTEAALLAFGSLAEGMWEVARDDHVIGQDSFEMDQLNDLVESVWNESNKQPDGSVVVVIDEGRRGVFDSVLENLLDGGGGEDEDEFNPADIVVDGQPATRESR